MESFSGGAFLRISKEEDNFPLSESLRLLLEEKKVPF